MPQSGEPLFTEEDTAYAIALAEEERDSCRACGMPKAWCRDNKDGRYKFEVADEFCWTTYHLAIRQDALAASDKKSSADRKATQLFATFRDGYEPDFGADLGPIEPDPEPKQQPQDHQGSKQHERTVDRVQHLGLLASLVQ